MILVLLKVAWNAYIYYVWKEKNFKVFVQKKETMQPVLDQIREVVRFSLKKLKMLKADHINILLYRAWNLFHNIFA